MIKNLNEESALKFKSLSAEEKAKRGILGRLYGKVADFTNGTRNGRKYEITLWEKLFESPLIKERFANGGIFGQLCHPDYTEVDMEKIAVVMPEPPVKDEDGQLVAYLDIVDTPCGRIAYQLAKYGYKFGISSRGEGDITTNLDGEEIVDPDTYTLSAFDLVEIPAVESARLSFTESLDTKKYNKTLRERLSEEIEKASDKEKSIMEETLSNLGIKLKENDTENKTIEDRFKEKGVKSVFDDKGFFTPEAEAKYNEIAAEYPGGEDAFDKLCSEEHCFNEDVSAAAITAAATFVAANWDKILKGIKDLGGTIDDVDSNVVNMIKRHKKLKTEECNTEECADKDVVQEDNAVENNEAEIVEELQETLQKNQELESKLIELQEKLSVCYAKEAKQEEEINKKSISIKRLSTDSKRAIALQEKLSKVTLENEELSKKFDNAVQRNKKLEESMKLSVTTKNSLRESIDSKSSEITQLKESYNQLSDKYEQDVDSLNESIAELKKDLKMKNSEYLNKIEKSNKLVEKYKRIANNAVNKYIDSQALKLGVTSNEIKNRLPESYTFDDIDDVCESLQDYKLTMSKLPFKINENFRVKTTTPKKENLIHTAEEDDYNVVDDSLLRLAGLK